MTETITIGSRFNGPPGSGNGGYSGGLLAKEMHTSGAVLVQLRAPPPLDTPLSVVISEDGLDARLGETLIIKARPADPLSAAPEAPAQSLAAKGPETFNSVEDHVFPACFVCGPLRERGDGLCLFTGRLEGYDGVGDLWRPEESICDETGSVRPEFLWAALDCPGAFAIGNQKNPMVLGQMTTQIHERPKAGETLTVAGWLNFHDGRKHGAGTAIYRADGTCLAQSEQIWIELKPKTA